MTIIGLFFLCWASLVELVLNRMVPHAKRQLVPVGIRVG